MRSIRLGLLFILLITCFGALHAQVPDSVKHYILSCVDVMQKQSVYAHGLNWKKIRDTVNRRLSNAGNTKEAEAAVIWAFNQLKDYHGAYNGIDTSYHNKKTGPEREFSKAILAEYQKPRSVKTKMLEGNIAYYKMPAVLIGSNTEQMKVWANILSDPICKLEAQQPRAYIIDLRMNNGGNIEPMWQALKNLVGEENAVFTTDYKKKILPADKDSAVLKYKSAAIPDRPCTFRKNIPVAVLIGPGTASSGEIMALSFTTRANTKLFGEPSIGVANVTNGFIVEDKGYLLLTVGYIADAHRKVLTNCYINPNIYIKNTNDNYTEPQNDPTILAALKWLTKK
jgi:C-terminal processing protease CtpA/Prc